MRKRQFRKALWLFLVATAMVAVVGKVSPAQRAFREGDTWLGWSNDAQQEYVWGFSAGYAGGYEKACRFMNGIWNGPKGLDADSDPLQKCFNEETVLSHGAAYYANEVTEFYTQYPTDRNIMIGEVLEKLAQGLTLQQIHDYPFPRRSPTPPKG